jgi:hypothetical protein
MSVVELEKAVASLSPKDFSEFLSWLDNYREEQWDQQITADLKAGKLNRLIAEAKQSGRDQQTKQLPGY